MLYVKIYAKKIDCNRKQNRDINRFRKLASFSYKIQ